MSEKGKEKDLFEKVKNIVAGLAGAPHALKDITRLEQEASKAVTNKALEILERATGHKPNGPVIALTPSSVLATLFGDVSGMADSIKAYNRLLDNIAEAMTEEFDRHGEDPDMVMVPVTLASQSCEVVGVGLAMISSAAYIDSLQGSSDKSSMLKIVELMAEKAAREAEKVTVLCSHIRRALNIEPSVNPVKEA
jgi:hypothetical protein